MRGKKKSHKRLLCVALYRQNCR